MQTNDFRHFSYTVITLGCILSFAAAVVPFYGTSYHLFVSVLFAGLLPYYILGIFTDVVRGWSLPATGLLILCIDVAVIVPERFLHYDGYTDGMIYYAALLATGLALVILGIGARLEQRWCGDTISLSGDLVHAPDIMDDRQ